MNRLAAGIAIVAAALLIAGLGEGSRGLSTLPAVGAGVRTDSQLPEGHPPLPERDFVLPEGHPPVYEASPALPEGHPVCPHGSARQDASDGVVPAVAESPGLIST